MERDLAHLSFEHQTALDLNWIGAKQLPQKKVWLYRWLQLAKPEQFPLHAPETTFVSGNQKPNKKQESYMKLPQENDRTKALGK
jgi:hypothetical protein